MGSHFSGMEEMCQILGNPASPTILNQPSHPNHVNVLTIYLFFNIFFDVDHF